MSNRVIVLAGVLALSFPCLFPDPVPVRSTGRPSGGGSPKSQPNPYLKNTSSCSVSGCHFNNGTAGERGNQYGTFFGADPHANMPDRLNEKRSRDMVLMVLGERAAPPSELPFCLGCHLSPDHGGVRGAGQGSSPGCQICHGPAEKWKERHALPGWKDVTPAEKAALGMRELWSPPRRAETCAGCHVGGAHGSITHDWIAAGHPPLFFELAWAMERLPRHWQVDKDGQGKPMRPSALWPAGILGNARAMLQSLSRLGPADEPDLPDFALQECASCHHPLQARGRPGRHGKEPVLHEWYTAFLKEAVGGGSPRLDRSLELLAIELRKKRPEAARIAERARDVLTLLPEADPPPLVASPSPRTVRPLTWTGAAQRYLRHRALAVGKETGRPRDGALEGMLFPTGRPYHSVWEETEEERVEQRLKDLAQNVP